MCLPGGIDAGSRVIDKSGVLFRVEVNTTAHTEITEGVRPGAVPAGLQPDRRTDRWSVGRKVRALPFAV